MKLEGKLLGKNDSGQITLIPEEIEDLWMCYNVIGPTDSVCCSTFRKVNSESSTGSVQSNKVKIKLTICVEETEFDPVTGMIRVKGTNLTESPHIKLGAFHTMELEINRKFTLAKHEWDTIALKMLQDACDPTNKADIGAVVLQEGLAHICLITSSLTLTRQRIEMQIPRKRGSAAAGRDKALAKFFEHIIQAIIRHFDFSVIRVVLVAGTDIVRESFMSYMNVAMQQKDMRILIENKSKFLPCHASSGHKHALREVLSSPTVIAKLSDTKAAEEIKILNNFFQMLSTDPDRALYGPKHVEIAYEREAIQTLLITDSLFRSQNIATRRRYVQLVEDVQSNAGIVRIFSTQHVTGKQLETLSGIAAILRYPIADIDDDEEGQDDDDDDDDDNNDPSAKSHEDISAFL